VSTTAISDRRIDSSRNRGKYQRRRNMQVQLSGQQIEVTEALRDHVNSRLDRLTRLDERIVNLSIVLSVNKLQQRAEGTLSVTGSTLHAEALENDMYVSIDVLFDKLVTQLRKHREKICDKHQRAVRDERLYG
jgi:putative sigma-54 modulation protein